MRLFALQAAAGELSAHAGNAFAHVAKPKHGGVVQAANDLSFELVAKGDIATIYIEDHDNPFPAAGATLIVLLHRPLALLM